VHQTEVEWIVNPDGSRPGWSWNPVTGCLNNCSYCFARKLANGRLKQRYLANMNVAPEIQTNNTTFGRMAITGYLNPFYPRFWEDRLYHAWDSEPKGIFTCDMSDLFGIGIPEEWTHRVLNLIKLHERNRYYLLTKQPQNLKKFSPFPDNCWVGVTATDYYSMFRALNGLAYLDGGIQARIKFISFEPLLESVAGPRLNFSGIDWVIIGGQSGKDKFYPPEDWIQEIESACNKVRIPVFLKNNLKPLLENTLRQELPQ